MACKIFDGLFVGDAESSQDSEFIELNKISYIINCAGRQLPNLYENHGLRYLTYPWLDTTDFQIFDASGVVVLQLSSFIDEALSNGEAVLVSSLEGVSRCSLCIIAYLMYKYWWSLQKSFEFITSKRIDLAPNKGFLTQLSMIDAQLQSARKRVCEEAGVGNNCNLGEALKLCSLKKHQFLPPNFLDFVPRIHKTLEDILESKLYEWDPNMLQQFIKLVGGKVNEDEEFLLLNSFVNSQSELEVLPGPGMLKKDHVSSRLHWIDTSRAGDGHGIGGVGNNLSRKVSTPVSGLRRRTSSGGIMGHNSVNSTTASLLERPPNSSYNKLSLDVGWVDRERQIKVDVNGEKPTKVLKSILKNGGLKKKHQQLQKGRQQLRDKSSSPEQRLDKIVKNFQSERNSPILGESAENSNDAPSDSKHLPSNFDNTTNDIVSDGDGDGSNTLAIQIQQQLRMEQTMQQQSLEQQISRGKVRAGGFRDSIVLSRDRVKNSDSSVANSLARAQEQERMLNLAAQQQVAAALNTDADVNTSINSSSTPSFNIPPSLMTSSSTGALNSHAILGSSLKSPISARPSTSSTTTFNSGSGGGVEIGGMSVRPNSAGAVLSGVGARQQNLLHQQQQFQKQQQLNMMGWGMSGGGNRKKMSSNNPRNVSNGNNAGKKKKLTQQQKERKKQQQWQRQQQKKFSSPMSIGGSGNGNLWAQQQSTPLPPQFGVNGVNQSSAKKKTSKKAGSKVNSPNNTGNVGNINFNLGGASNINTTPIYRPKWRSFAAK